MNLFLQDRMPPKTQNLNKHNIAKRNAEVDVAVAAAIASAKIKSDNEIAVFAARCAEIEASVVVAAAASYF